MSKETYITVKETITISTRFIFHLIQIIQKCQMRPTHILYRETEIFNLQRQMSAAIHIEHIELPAKLLDYFLRRNKSNINQCVYVYICIYIYRYICMYIYINAYIHVYIHIHRDRDLQSATPG